MRRSNRHHPSSAAADAHPQSAKSPTRSNSTKRTQAEVKQSGRASWPLKQQSVSEPRKQRAAAMVAKDAMILMTNNAVVKDLIKSPTSGKKDHPGVRAPKRASNGSVTSPSPIKQVKNIDALTTSPPSEPSIETPKDGNSERQHPKEEAGTSLLNVSSTLPRDLSAFPRELTVKEVIAKSMRANRVSMRGLSRDIVGIMKDMQTKETCSMATTSQDGNQPSPQHHTTTVQEVETLEVKKTEQRAPLVVTLDTILPSVLSVGANATQATEERFSDSRRQGHMTVQEVINPPLLGTVQSSFANAGNPRKNQALKGISSMDASDRSDGSNKKSGGNRTNLKCDEEMLVDVVGDGNSRSSDISRDLSVSEKVLMIADFDAGMLPHELEQKYNVTKMQVAEVLSNRIPIIRQQAASLSDRVALKRRRTNFVGLNIMMWRFFCDCRDQGIVLNGRQLKEHALTIARQLGLHNFKGSEGWLDSFKRRHSIDLKTMTGHPVIYETDNDGNVFCPGENLVEQYSPRTESPRTGEEMLNSSSSMIVDANQFLIDAADAAARAVTSTGSFSPTSNLNTLAIAACNTGEIGPCQATAAVHTTQPLDLAILPTTSTTGLSTPIIAQKTPPTATCVIRGQPLLTPVSTVSDAGIATIQALVDSCCYRVDEPEVAHAMETIRSYITMNDMSLLPALVTLQKGLAAIAANRRPKQQPSDSQHTTAPVSLTATLSSTFPDIIEQQASVTVSPATSSTNAVLGVGTMSLNGCSISPTITTTTATGLHNFKGSEGWLDSFKRRHSIDLKTMTGHPVIYETDNDGNVFCPGENLVEQYSPRTESPRTGEEMLNSSSSMIVDANQFLIDAADAAARAVTSTGSFSPTSNLNTLAIAACNTGEIGPCQATAAVHTTQPLDLAILPTTSTTGLSTPIIAQKTPPTATCVIRGQPLLTPVSTVSDAGIATIQALVDSCCYRVDEPEVAHAMETIRSYITMNDMSLLPALVTLQKGLAAIAANRRPKQQPSDSQHTTAPVSLTATLSSTFPDIIEQQASVTVSPATSSTNAVLGVGTMSLNGCSISPTITTTTATGTLKGGAISGQTSF
ncbi:Major centromere autoantigen B [Toxocara canis]|uniref:Major centromere autoantigen B n=1 Tax=Toxocara canis TaxID=6265 RepID=A0A0B2W415_TOXCA|nr:Major centromere autoantigen B [Toxocara canis]